MRENDPKGTPAGSSLAADEAIGLHRGASADLSGDEVLYDALRGLADELGEGYEGADGSVVELVADLHSSRQIHGAGAAVGVGSIGPSKLEVALDHLEDSDGDGWKCRNRVLVKDPVSSEVGADGFEPSTT